MLIATRMRILVELAWGSLLLGSACLTMVRWSEMDWQPRSTIVALGLYGVISALVLWRWPLKLERFGAANRVTLARAVLIAIVTGMIVGHEWRLVHAVVCCTITLVALALDGVDGALARRTGTSSSFGAAFDMELDALLVLVLSLACWRLRLAGDWVLVIGLMRYGMLAAAWLWPRLRGDVPPSLFAKCVCVFQIVALVVAMMPWVPRAQVSALLAIALALLTISFGRDVVWLLGRQQAPTLS